MSHGPPPKSPYGDTELTDDGWSRTSSISQADYPMAGGPPQPPNKQASLYGRPSQSQYNVPGQRLVPEQPQPTDFAAITQSMTQEDILFMRKVRMECLLYRVLPYTFCGCGAMYMYNKYKNLPHKMIRYTAVGVFGAFMGITTFRNRFKTMVADNRSHSFYMQSLRRTMNLPLLENDFAGDYGMEYGSKISGGDGSSNWDATDLSEDPRFSGQAQNDKTLSSFEPTSHQPQEQSQDDYGFESPKQTTTYDELRARNRGYIK